MSGIHPTTGANLARDGLHAAIVTAVAEDQVDVYHGFESIAVNADWIAVGSARSEIDLKNIGPRVSLDETITIAVNFGAFVPGRAGIGDISQRAYARAFELLEKVQRHVRETDLTLGGAVLWCVPAGLDADGAEYEGGFQVEIAADFICRHRVRAA